MMFVKPLMMCVLVWCTTSSLVVVGVRLSADKPKIVLSDDPGPAPTLTPAQAYTKQFNKRMNAARRKCDERYKLCAERVIGVYTYTNATVSSLSFNYTLTNKTNVEGVETKPGDMIVFDVPPLFWNATTIDRVWLIHRKEKKSALLNHTISLKSSNGVVYKWDVEAAYHSVSCWNDQQKKWKSWSGPRYATQKYEPRIYDDPVLDNRRYAPPRQTKWPLHDHLDDWSKFMDDGPSPCKMIMVRNVSPALYGAARGRIHGIRVEYRPFDPLDRKLDTQHIFTPGTFFRDVDTPLPHFGGGREISPTVFRHQKHVYPEASVVNNKGFKGVVHRYEPWLVFMNGGLVIRLRSNQSLAQCEVAMGTTQEPQHGKEGVVDRDGWVGQQGTAHVFAALRHPPNVTNAQVLYQDWVLDGSANGAFIMRFAPSVRGFTSPVGVNATAKFGSAVIRIDSLGNNLYIMGVRCQYYKVPEVPEQLGIPAPLPTQPPIVPPVIGTAIENTSVITNTTLPNPTATPSTGQSGGGGNKTDGLVTSMERSVRHMFGSLLGTIHHHKHLKQVKQPLNN